MGATVSVNKRVFAFRSGEEIVYALFENTYEKNCYPHSPHWGCVEIGNIQQVLRWIYRAAEAAEGGSLQGKTGWISPVSYLKGWMRELSSPFLLADCEVKIKYGTGFYDAIQPEAEERIRAKFLSEGRDATPIDQAIKLSLSKEALCLRLHEDAELIQALARSGVYRWRLLSGLPAISVRDESLGYNPTPPSRYDMHHRYVRMSTDVDPLFNSMLRQDVRTGFWTVEHLTSETWLSSLAHIEEMANPGSVLKGLRVHRSAKKAALFASLETVLTIRKPSPDESSWYLECYESLGEKIGKSFESECIVTTLKACYEAGAVPMIRNLDRFISDIQIDDLTLKSESDMRSLLASYRQFD